ncbi:MAG: PDZ domain-containing protein, partial [Planctomycetota bacterium]
TIFALFLFGVAAVLHAQESVLERLDGEIRDLAGRASPAVLKVSVERELRLPEGMAKDVEFLSTGSRVGTGFLIDRKGLVVTTHRLADGATEARVEFPDGVTRQGVVLGTSTFFNVAVVSIEPVENVTPLVLLEDPAPAFGSLTLFLGYSYGVSRNTSFGLVTDARVSGLPFDRFDNYLTINSRQNPGDTGGPFLDVKGRVIGMAVTAQPRVVGSFSMGTKGRGGVIRGFPGTAGPAYAIPAADLAFAIREIEAHGRVRSGRMGVNVLRQGLEVKDVLPDTPASRAGFEVGDVVLAIDEAPVHDVWGFSWILRRMPVDREFAVMVRRGEGEKTLRVALEEFVPWALPGISVAIRADGVTVRGVMPAHALFDARPGDRILAVDGEAAETGDALLAAIRAVRGHPKTLGVARDGEKITLEARVLEKKPPEKIEKTSGGGK